MQAFNDNTVDFFSSGQFKVLANQFLNGVEKVGINIIISILIWVIGKKVVNVIVNVLNKALRKTSLDLGVVKFVCSLSRFLGYIVLVIQIVGRLGFETSSFIALLGSAGLAFGLALQGSLSNFAGGVLILIFKPFRVGDYIINGLNEGTVKVIDLLYTKLVTADNRIITIPNGALANSSVVNVGSQETRRLDIRLSVSYRTELKSVKELLTNVMKQNQYILQENDITVAVISLDESRIALETRAWVNTTDFWAAKCQLLESYKEVFDEYGIEMPFNVMDLNKKL